ncbi:MAG: RT0821/Lpp0805 family surface protein [Pseudomonadota bacterium]|nr:RT0821/Lpp0805 family surface protein [Pseudomonadota bacterium]
MKNRFRPILRTLLPLVAVVIAVPLWQGSALADPPPWAPANGYRNKHHHDRDEEHDNEDEGDRDGRRVVVREVPLQPAYTVPYGIDRGTCNRQLVGQVIGGATGAALGSTIGKGNGNTAAIVGGTIIGVIVGGNIGQSMDRVDQGCVGQVLEHAADGRRVAWVDPNAGVRYQVTPQRPYQNAQGQYCRRYLTDAIVDGRNRQVTGLACRQSNGAWQMVN